MAPGRTLAKRQAATARRHALRSRPPSTIASISESSPTSDSQPARSPSPPLPLPPPVVTRPPSAPPLLNPPSANSPTSAGPPSSAASAALPPSPESPESESQLTARSIHSKSLYVRGGKNKRGVIAGTKTDNIVRLTGKKIVIKYSTFHNGPADRETCSLLARDIGSCVRNSVPMIQPSYVELKDTYQDIVGTYLTTNYEIQHDDLQMWDWVSEKAENCYKQWKHKCKEHWEQYGEDLPLEFLKRPEQWKWLVTHFKDVDFQALCTRNQSNRLRNPNQLNHHSGALALSYRASEHAEKGNPAPYVAAFLEAYGLDRNAKVVLDKVKRKLDEVMDTLSDGLAESIPVDDQVAVIEEGMGRKKGTAIRGVGAAIRRDPKRRGGARQNIIDTQAEERIQKAMEEAQLAKEEAQRAKEEAERSKEEFQRQQREVMDRLLALEAAAAPKQVQPSPLCT